MYSKEREMAINTENNKPQKTEEEIYADDFAAELASGRAANEDIADDDWAALWDLRKEKLSSRLGRC